jgi:flavin-dependent dehydrogenase
VLEVSHDDLVEPASYGIRRCEFDDYLLRRCGAELILGESCTRINRVGDAWEVNGHLRASILVGAGGHFCPVARHLGARPGQSECAVTAQEQEIRLSPSQQQRCNVDTQSPALYFCDDMRGYGWVFRKGDWINIGLGREDARRLPEQLSRFRQWLIDTGAVPPDLPQQFGGHAYLLAHHAKRRLTGDHVLLIGDAAGLAYPQSGEGIRPAVESGLLGAAVIRHHLGRFNAQAANEYVAAIERRFGARTRVSTPRRQQAGIKARVGRALLRLPWFGRHVVIDRWFLHRHVPALSDSTA